MEALPPDVRSNITSLAVDGTSATALLVDRDTREFLAPPLMYYMAQSQEYVEAVRVSLLYLIRRVLSALLNLKIAKHLHVLTGKCPNFIYDKIGLCMEPQLQLVCKLTGS